MAHDWDEYAANWEKDPATHAFAQSVFEHLTKILSNCRESIFWILAVVQAC